MIRLLNESDREFVLEYLYQDPEYNIFIIGDIEAFGFNQNFQRVYGEFDQDNNLLSVFLRYRENAVYYSDKLYFNTDYLTIFKKDPFVYFSGKTDLMTLINPYLSDFVLQRMYFCKAENTQLEKSHAQNTIHLLQTEKEAEALFDFIIKINEFNFHLKEKNDFVESKMNSLKMGVTYYIEEEGKIISTAATTAETEKSAMVVSVATDPEQRNKGFASELMKKLMQVYFNEKNKSLCLFYDNPKAGQIYLRLGFKTLGTWDMYHRQ